jgi:hypothetical protein
MTGSARAARARVRALRAWEAWRGFRRLGRDTGRALYRACATLLYALCVPLRPLLPPARASGLLPPDHGDALSPPARASARLPPADRG